MRKALTWQEITRRLRRTHPYTVEDLLIECRLPLRYLSSGSFRHVFHIIGTQYVVKVPRSDERQGIEHARQEYNSWRRVIRSPKYRRLVRYMPDILFFSRVTGVMVMERYKPVETSRYDSALDDIEEITQDVLKVSKPDLGAAKWNNYGLDYKNRVRIIDLGRFKKGGV